MKYKTSGIAVVDIRGKLGGNSFGRNAYGNVLQVKTSRVGNHSTNSQHKYRGLLSIYSAKWRTLSQLERDQWLSAAHTYPFPSAFLGGSVKHTGKTLYVRCNVNLRIFQRPTITSPLPVVTPPTLLSCSVTDSTSVNLTIYFDFVSSLGSVNDWKLLVQCSRDISAGNNVRRNVKIIEAFRSILQANNVSFGDSYFDTYGSHPRIGSKVFFRLSLVHKDSGQSAFVTEIPILVT